MRKFQRWSPVAVLLAAVATLSGTVTASPVDAQAAISASDPGSAPWEQVPADQVASACGLDPDLLRQANEQLPSVPFTVVRYGKLCWSNLPEGTTSTYHVASVTKTLGSVLFGMIADRSSLDDTDPVTEWIPWYERGTINRKATMAHLLAMTSTGLSLETDQKVKWSYDAVGLREIDRLVGVMNRAIQREPQNFPGVTNVQQFAQRELFDVLGMRDSSWAGNTIAYSMNSTTQDLSRLGLLLLRKGNWGGKQLLDEKYVYRMTHPAFEDANTGWGYLTQLNAHAGQTYSSGTPDRDCSPYATWPSYPHAPFNATTHNYGGSPYTDERYDVGLAWASGFGGQRVSVHRGLDLVITVRDDSTNEGHKRVWEAVRPALVELDPRYQGDEAAFCAAYQQSHYAPTLLSPWSPEASR